MIKISLVIFATAIASIAASCIPKNCTGIYNCPKSEPCTSSSQIFYDGCCKICVKGILFLYSFYINLFCFILDCNAYCNKTVCPVYVWCPNPHKGGACNCCTLCN